MSNYYIPPPLIDPRALPPPLMTSEPGSFARRTLAVRVPRILLDTLDQNDFPAELRRDLLDLHSELTQGSIRPLLENAADRDFWNSVSAGWFGRSWLDVPWYWAETYFYRRVLEATRYFQPGAFNGYDPYRRVKQAELVPGAAPLKLAAVLQDLPADAGERFGVLLYSSLWGNRVDLSYKVAAHAAATLEQERANLLVDDRPALWEFLTSRRPGQVLIIADNSGTELLFDLALIDFLLHTNLVGHVFLHLKPQPFFVSDAMPADVEAALRALREGEPVVRDLAGRLERYRREERLTLETHWFYSTCLFFFQLPQDLLNKLAGVQLVLLKGDANYRRLLGDAHWDSTTPFSQVTRYFPAPLVALRTLKAEEIVGLPPGWADELRRLDPDWMVNGRRGLVQARGFHGGSKLG